MAPTDGEDEKILFQRVDAALEKQKKKEKGIIILLQWVRL